MKKIVSNECDTISVVDARVNKGVVVKDKDMAFIGFVRCYDDCKFRLARVDGKIYSNDVVFYTLEALIENYSLYTFYQL
jgi:hypothetical protein